ncbi:zinc-binding dehydrogenase [Leuconostoc mesenteroides]|nr:zinc-binding dehydrogenase [Leuconostoc mesenteroides]
MKAVVVTHPGGPEVLQLVERPKPKLKPGWSRIKIKGFGLNHSEIFTRKGLSPSVQFPRVLGIEVVGIIDATTSPKTLPVGQKVVSIMGEMGRNFDGSYAEYVLVPNHQIFYVNTALEWQELAALPESFYTAFGIFKSLQIKPNDHILIRGVSSSVGVAVVKLIKSMSLSCTINGTTRSIGKVSKLHQVGVDHVTVTENPNLLPEGNTKYSKIADLVGPSSLLDSFQHLSEFGILSSTGQLGGQWTLPEFDPIMDIPNNRYLTGFYSGDVSQSLLEEMIMFVTTHSVDLMPEKVFSLNQIREAHEYMDNSMGIGKVVVMTDD